ncbi:MAG: GIY-YIG nuclease family protein [Actinomycetota bacterium]|nr:GIY-YIG nuclease family protein [Actinomycetota bacterium]
MGGNYCLIISLEASVRKKVGRLGWLSFCQGYYIYIGSAKSNMDKRLARHSRKEKKLYWHIDYLLDSPHSALKAIYSKNWEKGGECKTARRLRDKLQEIDGFGASDCSCNSHLYYFKPGQKAMVKIMLTGAGYKEIGKL